jgi:hypothetical protein
MFLNYNIIVPRSRGLLTDKAKFISITDSNRLELFCFWKLWRVLTRTWLIFEMILVFTSPRNGIHWTRNFLWDKVRAYPHTVTILVCVSFGMRNCDSVGLVPLFKFWVISSWAGADTQLRIRFLLFFYWKSWSLWQNCTLFSIALY